MNVSFDFDGTLSKKEVRAFARYCIDKGLSVWIVTSRGNEGLSPSYNQQLFEIARLLRIPFSQIIFTNGGPKKDYFRQFPDYIFHLDDDWIELEEINKHTEVKAISAFGNSDWEQECWSAIQEYKSQCPN